MSGRRARERRQQEAWLEKVKVPVLAWCDYDRTHFALDLTLTPGASVQFQEGVEGQCPHCNRWVPVPEGDFDYSATLARVLGVLPLVDREQLLRDLQELLREPQVDVGFFERHPTLQRLLQAAEPKSVDDYVTYAKSVRWLLVLLLVVLHAGDIRQASEVVMRTVLPNVEPAGETGREGSP